MKNGKAKFFGIIIILLSFLLSSVVSLYITNPSILDTDSTTYIIVVMLMLFLFIAFSAKEDLQFRYSRMNLAYGIILFAIYLALLSYLRVYLSFAFLSYRIDALLFPLLLFSLVMLVFGSDGVKKLLPVIVYAAFASPLLLMPLLNLNNAFANANARMVYGFVKFLGISASRTGLVILSNAGSSITISTTCVSIGIFVAFAMFLVPLAYLYEGNLKRKIYWIASGVLLILSLNALRMLLVTFVWVYYGLNSAITLFHAFAGQLIFYLAILIIMLISNRYGLRIGKIRKGAVADFRGFYRLNDRRLYLFAMMPFILALASLFFNSGYNDAVYAPAIVFANGSLANGVALHQRILASLANSRNNVISLGATPRGEIFTLMNRTSYTNDSTYVIANESYNLIAPYGILSYNSIGRAHSYLLRNGITISAQAASSKNATFELNYFSVPYNISGTWVSVNYVLFKRIAGSAPKCDLIAGSIGLRNYLESSVYNLANSQNYSTVGFICQSYLIAGSR